MSSGSNLRRRDELIALEPQVFDLLNRERVVSKDDLIEHGWQRRIVSDAALAMRLNAVGDSGARKEVRFVGAVEEVPEAAPALAPPSPFANRGRRPVAILAADVAGYSRLMGADEEGTHERLKTHLRELVDPKIREHRRQIVKNTGNGFLAEFGRIVDAMRCALECVRTHEVTASIEP